MAFTLKLKSNNKTNKGSGVNRTEKQNVDQNAANKYCNRSLQMYVVKGKEKEREGEWETTESKKYGHCEKYRLHSENKSNDDYNRGWRIRSARQLYPLPYLPNSVQTYKCNNKKQKIRDHY